MTIDQKIITVVGGTGFLGRYVVRRLAKAGFRVRVISRLPENAAYLKTAGDVGQIALLRGDIANPDTLAGKIEGSWAVINLVGKLYETRKQRFAQVHAQGAEKLAKMAKAAGAKRFIQVSALGIDKAGSSLYAKTKDLGEKAVMAAFPQATVLRPSVMFGPEDNFFNQFAQLATSPLFPFVPLIGGGYNKFQPVYVDDVALAIETCLEQPETEGKIFELGGPQVLSMRQILDSIYRCIGKRAFTLTISYRIAALMGSLLQLLPKPMLTRDQVSLLRHDNVVSHGALGFEQLNIHPTPIDMVVPNYLNRFRKPASQVKL